MKFSLVVSGLSAILGLAMIPAVSPAAPTLPADYSAAANIIDGPYSCDKKTSVATLYAGRNNEWVVGEVRTASGYAFILLDDGEEKFFMKDASGRLTAISHDEWDGELGLKALNAYFLVHDALSDCQPAN